MESTEVDRYKPDRKTHPGMWKAQRAFLSAEMLKDKDRYGCAANRYYYAVFHVAQEFLGYRKRGEEGHADFMWDYVREYDLEATGAISRVQGPRKLADYTPSKVRYKKVKPLVKPVADMICRAMDRLEVSKEAT